MLDDVTRGMFLATKAADSSRPVLDASGYSHRVPETDVYDSHDYEQDPAKFAEDDGGPRRGQAVHQRTAGQDKPTARSPTAASPTSAASSAASGGTRRARQRGGADQDASWGYGEAAAATLEEFYDRFDGLVGVLLDDPDMFGYCYTQLTDVFQEQNGIYRFDRTEKFDLERIRAAQTRTAAIEKDRG